VVASRIRLNESDQTIPREKRPVEIVHGLGPQVTSPTHPPVFFIMNPISSLFRPKQCRIGDQPLCPHLSASAETSTRENTDNLRRELRGTTFDRSHSPCARQTLKHGSIPRTNVMLLSNDARNPAQSHGHPTSRNPWSRSSS